jgi:hypothetical protein
VSWLVQLSVVVTLVVTVFVAAFGYGATYLTNVRLARRKDHLDWINRQFSELYHTRPRGIEGARRRGARTPRLMALGQGLCR